MKFKKPKIIDLENDVRNTCVKFNGTSSMGSNGNVGEPTELGAKRQCIKCREAFFLFSPSSAEVFARELALWSLLKD